MRINNKDYSIISTPESLYGGISIRLNDGYIVYLEQEEIKEIVDHLNSTDFVLYSLDEYEKNIQDEWQKGYDECEDGMRDEIDDASDEGYKEGFNEAELEAKEKIAEIEYRAQERIDELTKQIEDLKENHKKELKKEYQYGRDYGYEDGVKEANA